jgi:hypothetical protein
VIITVILKRWIIINMKEECYKYGRSGVSTWQLSLPGTGPAVVDAPTRYSSYMNYPWKFRPIV